MQPARWTISTVLDLLPISTHHISICICLCTRNSRICASGRSSGTLESTSRSQSNAQRARAQAQARALKNM